MDEIVVIGGGGHAKVVVSVLKKNQYAIAGYTDRNDRGPILGVRYLGNDAILPKFFTEHTGCKAIIGIGKLDVSPLRLSLQDEISMLGYTFPAICSPHAIVNEDVILGAGAAILDGAVVNSGTAIGKACIVNTNSTVEHDCRIGANVHIAPGVTLSGGVTIGNNCMVGISATVIQSISICEGCLIGAGSVVVRNIAIPGTYAGAPAQRVK